MIKNITAAQVPENLLLSNAPGQQLWLTRAELATRDIHKKDLAIFIDNSKLSQYYLPTLKPIICDFIRREQPRSFLTDVLTINCGIKNLVCDEDVEANCQRVSSVLYTDKYEEFSPAEMFHTLNAYLDSKLERNTTTRTSIVLVTFAAKATPSVDLIKNINEFRRKTQLLPVDLHVVSFGAAQPASVGNLLAGLGSLYGSYQACALNFDPEKLSLEAAMRQRSGNAPPSIAAPQLEPPTETDEDRERRARKIKKDKKKTVTIEPTDPIEKLVYRHKENIHRDGTQSFDVISKYLSTADDACKIGNDSSRLLTMPMHVREDRFTTQVVLPSVENVVVEIGTNTYGRSAEKTTLDEAGLRFVVAVSARGVLNNFDKFTRDKRTKEILANLVRNKKDGFYYGWRHDDDFHRCLVLLEQLLVTQLGGGQPEMKTFAEAATLCSRLLVADY